MPRTNESTQLAEMMLSFRRILETASAPTVNDEQAWISVIYEAERGLKAGQSLSVPATANAGLTDSTDQAGRMLIDEPESEPEEFWPDSL